MKLLEPQSFRGAGLVAIKMPRVPAARKKAIDGGRRPAPAVNLDPRTGQIGQPRRLGTRALHRSRMAPPGDDHRSERLLGLLPQLCVGGAAERVRGNPTCPL
ncbi:MAG: hypothetical protein ING52_04570 [Burkholderiales bacterium]|nr:hypothetical protein [Burkholderiales bacterium]